MRGGGGVKNPPAAKKCKFFSQNKKSLKKKCLETKEYAKIFCEVFVLLKNFGIFTIFYQLQAFLVSKTYIFNIYTCKKKLA